MCVIETFLQRPLPPCTTHTRSLFLCTWFLSPQITSKLCLFIELFRFFLFLLSASPRWVKNTRVLMMTVILSKVFSKEAELKVGHVT